MNNLYATKSTNTNFLVNNNFTTLSNYINTNYYLYGNKINNLYSLYATISGNILFTGIMNNNLNMNSNIIYLAGNNDSHHQLQYNTTIDGPILQGYSSVKLQMTGYSLNYMLLNNTGLTINCPLIFNDGSTISSSSNLLTATSAANNYLTISNAISIYAALPANNMFVGNNYFSGQVLETNYAVSNFIPTLTSNSLFISSATGLTSYQNGQYNAFSSSATVNAAYRVFDNNATTAWQTAYSYNSTTGAYTGSSVLSGFHGEYIIICLPNEIVATTCTITNNGSSSSTTCWNIVILGINGYSNSTAISGTGISYTALYGYTGPTGITNNSTVGLTNMITFPSTPNTNAFNTYAVIFTSLNVGYATSPLNVYSINF